MPVCLTPRTDVSLADLMEHSRQGAYVIKTPHVGNIYPNNLAIANLGIPLVLVDQTIGSRDTNFHPHLLIADGEHETVADADKLTAQSRITTTSKRYPSRFFRGASLADAHTQSLRDALKRARIQTTSERIREHADLISAYLELMTRAAPQMWQRTVTSDGDVHTMRFPPTSWENVLRQGVHALPGFDSGWIIPNAWNILSDGLIGATVTGRDTVFSLSGPDMIAYAPRLAPDLSRWYDMLRVKLNPKLPETLTIALVPVADMRFVTTRDRAHALDALIDTYLHIQAAKRQAGARFEGLSRADRSAMIHQIETERKKHLHDLQEAMQNCPEVFYRIEDANCFTQYDLLNGKELYVHPWGIHTPIAEVIDAIRTMRRFLVS